MFHKDEAKKDDLARHAVFIVQAPGNAFQLIVSVIFI